MFFTLSHLVVQYVFSRKALFHECQKENLNITINGYYHDIFFSVINVKLTFDFTKVLVDLDSVIYFLLAPDMRRYFFIIMKTLILCDKKEFYNYCGIGWKNYKLI